MSKEEITKHKSETHEVAVALSRACPACPVPNRFLPPALAFLWRASFGVGSVAEWDVSCFEFSFLEIYNYHT